MSRFTRLSPLLQFIAIMGIALFFYYLVSIPKSSIDDFEIYQQYAYLATGSDGIGVIDLNNPEELEQVGNFRCAGPNLAKYRSYYNFLNCTRSAHRIFLSENKLYLADTRTGLWKLDLSTDPTKPSKEAQTNLPGRQQDVVVVGNYAYVASGKSGVRVVKINRPAEVTDEENNKSKKKLLEDLPNSVIEGNATRTWTDQHLLYWLDNHETLYFSNIEKPEEPSPSGSQKFDQNISDIAFRDSIAFIANGKAGLQIYDTSTIAASEQMTLISQLEIKDGVTQGVFLSGNHAYLAVKDIGLVIVDITDLQEPRIVQKPYPINGNPTQVYVQGSIAYLANGKEGFYALDARVNVKTELLGQTGAQLIARGVTKSGNYLYVAAGERGLRILDINNPQTPQEVAFYDTAGRSDAVAVTGDAALIADRNNGLVIVDTTNHAGMLPLLTQIPSKDARDVAIDGNYAYLADFEEGLRIVDIRTPGSAFLLKTMDPIPGQEMKPVSVSVLGNYAYLATGDQGIRIVNVLDKQIPTQVQQILVPGQADARNVALVAYNPQIQGPEAYKADPNAPGVKVYAYVANGLFGLQVLDVSNPSQSIPIAMNLDAQIVHLQGIAMDVAIVGDRAYLAYDGGGLFILNIADPANPQFLGEFNLSETENRAVSLAAEGQTVYLAALSHGIRLFDVSTPSAPIKISQFDSPASVVNMAVQGNYAFTVDGSRGLWIFDISDPKLPQEIRFVPISQASGVSVLDDYAYIAAGVSGLQVVSIADKKAAYVMAGLDTDGYANAILTALQPGASPARPLAYIADGEAGLVSMDITNPAAPSRLGGLSQIGPALKLTYNQENYIFVTADQAGLVAVNVVDPAKPARMDTQQVASQTRGSAIINHDFAYVAAGYDGTVILDVSYPLYMTPVGSKIPSEGQFIEDVSSPISVSNPISPTIPVTATLSGPIFSLNPNYAFLAERRYGIGIYETTDPVSPQRRGEWAVPMTEQVTDLVEIIPDIVQVIGVWNAPDPDGEDPGIFTFYVADKLNGFSILQGVKKTEIKVLGVYETPGAPTLITLKSYFQAFRSGSANPSPKTTLAIQQFIFSFILFGLVGFFFWVGFLALFVLPSERFLDWENLYSRLVFYLFGRHGPILRVREGKFIGPESELGRHGPGVVLADSSSAVVLEKYNVRGGRAESLSLARVVNSGIVYTGNRVFLTRPRFDEKLRGVVDLRPQVRIASPVNGYTRDGIEIEASIFTIFTLGEFPEVLRVTYAPGKGTEEPENMESTRPYLPQPEDLKVVSLRQNQNGEWEISDVTDEIDDSDRIEIHQFIITDPSLQPLDATLDNQARRTNPDGPPFVVEPVSVFQAIFAQADDLPENRQLEWYDLPNFIAIEHFRNLLAREIYDHLYDPLHASNYPIRDVRTNLRRWVRNQGVLSYQFIRSADNQPLEIGQIFATGDLLVSNIQLLRTPKILRSRGIKVKFAGFSELDPTDPNVRKQFFDFWQAQRERDAAFVLSDFDLDLARLRNQWRIQAQQEILNEFINILDANPNANEALAMHVLQTLESAATDSETSPLLPEQTIEMLRNLRNWLLRP